MSVRAPRRSPRLQGKPRRRRPGRGSSSPRRAAPRGRSWRCVVGRYYDPTTGQFLTVDPLVDLTGAPYAYAAGDPVDNDDPSGQSVPLDFGAYGFGTYDGGSNGAHPGCPTWGNGQLNGYGSLQDAVDDDAPGLTAAFGNLTGNYGLSWSDWVQIATFPFFGDEELGADALLDGGGAAADESGTGILEASEAADGHAILKHVGQTDAQLLARLVAEPQITGASTFADLATAESAVSDVLAANQSEIEAFLAGGKNSLALNGEAPGVIGRYVAQGSTDVSDVSGVRVILQRDPSLASGYRIQTAFAQP